MGGVESRFFDVFPACFPRLIGRDEQLSNLQLAFLVEVEGGGGVCPCGVLLFGASPPPEALSPSPSQTERYANGPTC